MEIWECTEVHWIHARARTRNTHTHWHAHNQEGKGLEFLYFPLYPLTPPSPYMPFVHICKYIVICMYFHEYMHACIYKCFKDVWHVTCQFNGFFFWFISTWLRDGKNWHSLMRLYLLNYGRPVNFIRGADAIERVKWFWAIWNQRIKNLGTAIYIFPQPIFFLDFSWAVTPFCQNKVHKK